LSFLGRKQNLKRLVENIMLIKEKVKEKLRLLRTPGSWNHITEQMGTHAYLGLSRKCPGWGGSLLSDVGPVFEH
jgi:aspartate/tyrosine/aromatic aminotransferase